LSVKDKTGGILGIILLLMLVLCGTLSLAQLRGSGGGGGDVTSAQFKGETSIRHNADATENSARQAADSALSNRLDNYSGNHAPVVFSGINGSYTIDNPYATVAANWVNTQIHGHTTNSDGMQNITSFVQAYKTAGYGAVLNTDHNVVVNADPAIADTVYLGPGMEDSSPAGNLLWQRHFVTIGKTASSTLTNYVGSDINALVNGHIANGDWVQWAHPRWIAQYSGTFPKAEYLTWPVTAVEIYNTVVTGGDLSLDASPEVDAFLGAGKRIWIVAVDDCHDTTNATLFNKGHIKVNCDALTRDSIIDAMFKGRFIASQGPRLTVTQNGKVIRFTTYTSSDITVIGDNGRTLKTASGTTYLAYTTLGNEGYIRGEIKHVASTRRAWSNPIYIVSAHKATTGAVSATLQAVRDYYGPVNPTTLQKVYGNYSTGDDVLGDGSSGNPYATAQKVIDAIPGNPFTNYSAYWTSGGKDTSGLILTVSNRILKDCYIYFQGLVTTLASGTITSYRNNAPSGVTIFADGSKSWTTNQHQYKFAIISTASGKQYRGVTLNNNTGVTVATKFATNPTAGVSTYRIYQCDAKFDGTGAPRTTVILVSNVKGFNIADVEVQDSTGNGILWDDGSRGNINRVSSHNNAVGLKVLNAEVTTCNSSMFYTNSTAGIIASTGAIFAGNYLFSKLNTTYGAQNVIAASMFLTDSEIGATGTGVFNSFANCNITRCNVSSTNTADVDTTKNGITNLTDSTVVSSATYGIRAQGGGKIYKSGSNTITGHTRNEFANTTSYGYIQ
jgi:hypothetical protein